MIFGTLQKITIQKKLMILVDRDTYERTLKTATALATKLKFVDAKLPIWSFVPRLLEEESFDESSRLLDKEPKYYVLVKLDYYDSQNMPKFERLVKQPVVINGNFRDYDFVPNGESVAKQGVNFQLTSITKRIVKTSELDKIALKGFAMSQGISDEPVDPVEQEAFDKISKAGESQAIAKADPNEANQ